MILTSSLSLNVPNDTNDSFSRQIELLENYDFFILIDKGGSIKGENKWSELQKLATLIYHQVTPLIKNNLDLCFFSDRTEWTKSVKTILEINELFDAHSPEGLTDIELALRESFNKHFYRKKKLPNQQTMIFLLTDKEPKNASSFMKMIQEISKKLDLKNVIINPNQLHVSIYTLETDRKTEHFYQSLTSKHPALISLGNITNIFHNIHNVKKD